MDRCWDSATYEPLNDAKEQNSTLPIPRVRCATCQPVMCADLHFLLHCVITIHQRYRQTDRQHKHKRSISAAWHMTGPSKWRAWYPPKTHPCTETRLIDHRIVKIGLDYTSFSASRTFWPPRLPYGYADRYRPEFD